MRLLFVLFLSPLLTVGSGLMFELQRNRPRRCLSDDVKAGVFVNGIYNVSKPYPIGSPTDMVVSLQVTDLDGQIVYQKSPATDGKFTFVLERDQRFTVCFEGHVNLTGGKYYEKVTRHVEFRMTNMLSFGSRKQQFEMQWKGLNLSPLEQGLMLAENFSDMLVDQIYENEASLRAIRMANYRAGDLFLWVSLSAMLFLTCLTLWQIFYLRNFFRIKKLID